jgi:GMP synthase-like glutamine amidotransferase
LEVTARGDDGVIMALAHRGWPIYGVQFHPESILTQGGFDILINFLRLADIHVAVDRPGIDQEQPAQQDAPSWPAQPVTF